MPLTGKSRSAVPLVAYIAPVAAVLLRHEHELREVLGVLVAELHGRVHACRSTVLRAEHVTVHPVRDKRLRMHGGIDIPALVVVVVEAPEVDIPCIRRDAGDAGDVAHTDASPFGAGIPSFHAEVVDLLRDVWQAHEVIEAE